jgi:hypothetical protein
VEPLTTGTPDWIRDAIRSAWGELKHFFATAFAFTRDPRGFAQRWSRGEEHAMNPLAYSATSLGLVSGLAVLVKAVLPYNDDGPDSLLNTILGSVGPYAHYLGLGIICHLFVRAGRGRGPWRGTVACAIFAAGGPAALASVPFFISVAYVHFITKSLEISLTRTSALHVWVATGLAVVALLAFAVPFALALAGLHGTRARWSGAALAAALIATGTFFGYVDPPGSYGVHLQLALRRKANAKDGKQEWGTRAAIGL